MEGEFPSSINNGNRQQCSHREGLKRLGASLKNLVKNPRGIFDNQTLLANAKESRTIPSKKKKKKKKKDERAIEREKMATETFLTIDSFLCYMPLITVHCYHRKRINDTANW